MVRLLVDRKKALELINKSAQEATLSDFIKFVRQQKGFENMELLEEKLTIKTMFSTKSDEVFKYLKEKLQKLETFTSKAIESRTIVDTKTKTIEFEMSYKDYAQELDFIPLAVLNKRPRQTVSVTGPYDYNLIESVFPNGIKMVYKTETEHGVGAFPETTLPPSVLFTNNEGWKSIENKLHPLIMKNIVCPICGKKDGRRKNLNLCVVKQGVTNFGNVEGTLICNDCLDKLKHSKDKSVFKVTDFAPILAFNELVQSIQKQAPAVEIQQTTVK